MGNNVIFSIDNVENLRNLSKFTHHMDKLEAGGKTRGKTIPCIGAYQGKLEVSFISTEEDYKKYVVPYGFVDWQESVVVIGPDGVAYLSDNLLHTTAYLGRMVQVKTDEELDDDKGWTYRMDQGEYYHVST